MSRVFFLPVRIPVRLVRNCIWLFAPTPSLPMKASSAPGNNGRSTVVCETILHRTWPALFFHSKSRQMHMELSKHFCPLKLPFSGNLEYRPNFSVTFTEKFSSFPSYNILLCRNYFMFPWHFPENLSRFMDEFSVKQALDLGHLRVAILRAR